MNFRNQFAFLTPTRKILSATTKEGEIEIPEILTEEYKEPTDVISELLLNFEYTPSPRVIRAFKKGNTFILTYMVFVEESTKYSSGFEKYIDIKPMKHYFHHEDMTIDTEDILGEVWPLLDVFRSYEKSLIKDPFVISKIFG